MKFNTSFLGLILLIISSSFASSSTWDHIREKTWVSISGGCINGEQIVFYESKNGIKKAIQQLYGSGVYVIATVIYDVDFSHDTLFLRSSIPNRTEDFILIYIDKDSILVSSNDILRYRKFSNEPIVYNWQGNYHAGKRLPIDTLKSVQINKGMEYDKDIFKNSGLIKKINRK